MEISSIQTDQVAHYGNGTDQIRTYEVSSGTWSEVDTPATASGSFGALTYMPGTSTDVAWIERNGDSLQMYRRSAGVWATLGSGLNQGVLSPAMTGVNSTDLVQTDVSGSIFYFRHDGTTFAQVGTSGSAGSMSFPSITTLYTTPNTVDVIVANSSSSNAQLQRWRWDNTAEDFTKIGDTFTLTTTDSTAIAALSSSAIAILSESDHILKTLLLSGDNTWTVSPDATIDYGTFVNGVVRMTEMGSGSGEVTIIDDTNEELRSYQLQ
jgi:hypothetical protein